MSRFKGLVYFRAWLRPFTLHFAEIRQPRQISVAFLGLSIGGLWFCVLLRFAVFCRVRAKGVPRRTALCKLRPVRSRQTLALGLWIVPALLLLGHGDASARKNKPHIRYDGASDSHPSVRYASMSAASCHAELKRRGIAFRVEEKAKGVLAPVRLLDRVSGVLFRTAAPPGEREQTPYEVLDCRLVLSLSDWSVQLLARGIDEVLFFSAWRPPSAAFPEGQLPTRHPGALAIDVYRFGKRLNEGHPKREWIDVERDFRGRKNSPVCAKNTDEWLQKQTGAANSQTLRRLVCAAAGAHLFTSILTPNYDRAHKNHLHLELVPEARWHLLR